MNIYCLFVCLIFFYKKCVLLAIKLDMVKGIIMFYYMDTWENWK